MSVIFKVIFLIRYNLHNTHFKWASLWDFTNVYSHLTQSCLWSSVCHGPTTPHSSQTQRWVPAATVLPTSLALLFSLPLTHSSHLWPTVIECVGKDREYSCWTHSDGSNLCEHNLFKIQQTKSPVFYYEKFQTYPK